MLYLIICDSDKSYCTVEDYEIVYDIDQPPQVDDNVQFFYGKDKYSGTIVAMSDDANVLREKTKQLKGKRKVANSPPLSPLPDKRSRKPKKSWSFSKEQENLQNEKQKKGLGKSKKGEDKLAAGLQKQVKSAINNDKDATSVKQNINKPLTDSSAKSPTKEELRLMIEKQAKLLASYQGSSTSQTSTSTPMHMQKKNDMPDNDDDDSSTRSDSDDNSNGNLRKSKKIQDINDDPNNALPVSEDEKNNTKEDLNVHPQLYGKNCGEPVVLLKDGIYCKKVAFDDAEDSCRKSASSFLRRLMEGVFKHDAILNSTPTGRSPSAQGNNKQTQRVQALDRTARRVIIEYSNAYAVKQGWPELKESELKATMSQCVGEIKRRHKKNLQREA